jgi:hypothetical protein
MAYTAAQDNHFAVALKLKLPFNKKFAMLFSREAFFHAGYFLRLPGGTGSREKIHIKEERSMELLAEYHLWIMIAVLVGLVLLPQEHRKKKSVLTLIVVLAFSIGYELVMSEPVTEMPGRINRTLNQDGAGQTTNPHYYKTPDEQLNE